MLGGGAVRERRIVAGYYSSIIRVLFQRWIIGSCRELQGVLLKVNGASVGGSKQKHPPLLSRESAVLYELVSNHSFSRIGSFGDKIGNFASRSTYKQQQVRTTTCFAPSTHIQYISELHRSVPQSLKI